MEEIALWEEEEEEEEGWRCRKHPSQPCYGVCAACLRDRLLLLCPDCANVRPCGCSPLSSSSSLSSASSLSSFSYAVLGRSGSCGAAIGAVGRVSNLIQSEPAFRRSRPEFQLLRSRSVAAALGEPGVAAPPQDRGGRGWGAFWPFSRRKGDGEEQERKPPEVQLSRSRSVGVVAYPDSGGGGGKAKGWRSYFPSPMKAFRYRKSTKVVKQRSPLSRG
ncbi:uncharacterized protein [Elaeis guineensis]|uniref:Uncharacterized protein LOC105053855 n=1 Tax=Elaeis guineensis var. tenera TaxID=51953 RepID=A0A6I9S4W4_ELAGV|nr:uncharacterized protein LOC105053855 [Elaeis guineensis]